MNGLDFDLNGYYLDPEYAQTLISQYKDLLWLVLTLISTCAVFYGVILPQKNNLKQKKLESTLSLIDQWMVQDMPGALNEYQCQVLEDRVRNIASESKTRLFSFFHKVALLIREKKVDEALIRKSQVGMGFVCFYTALQQEHPGLLDGHSFYGKEFRPLFQRWKGLAKLSRAQRRNGSPAMFDQMFPGTTPLPPKVPATTAVSSKPLLHVLPRS